MTYWRSVFVFVLLVGIVLLLNVDTQAQCSMCKASLAGSNSNFVRSFNTAILVLLVPPVTIFCSIFIVLRKHSGGRGDQDTQD
jgi:hypothetical protein